MKHILRIARPTHTCRLWFHVLRLVLRSHRVDISAEDAEVLMRSKHAPMVGSSVMSNEVAANPVYDLLLIVPTFNGGTRLQVCVGSILGQEAHYRFCVVVVDDGSTDGSAERLRQECDDPRLTILSFDSNRGVSAARNAALRHIDARYVSFVDADDELPHGAIEAWLDAAYRCDADVVEGAMDAVCDGCRRPWVTHTDAQPSADLTGYACGKIFRSTLFANVGFPTGVRYEDTVLSFVVYRMAKHKVTISRTTYLYTQHHDSFTSKEYGNVASLDAYWVVKGLLADMPALHLADDASLYDALLLGMKLSGPRVDSLGRDVGEAYFAAMTKLAQPLMHDGVVTLKYIDRAIRTGDYTLYMLASYLL